MSQQRNQQGRTIRRDMRIYYPTMQEGLVVPVSAWNGLIGRITGLKSNFRPWSVAYSVLFGIGITSGLSIAQLDESGAPAWMVATYAAASATALILGVGLLLMERQLSKHQASHISQLVDEMDQIRAESLGGESN